MLTDGAGAHQGSVSQRRVTILRDWWRAAAEDAHTQSAKYAQSLHSNQGLKKQANTVTDTAAFSVSRLLAFVVSFSLLLAFSHCRPFGDKFVRRQAILPQMPRWQIPPTARSYCSPVSAAVHGPPLSHATSARTRRLSRLSRLSRSRCPSEQGAEGAEAKEGKETARGSENKTSALLGRRAHAGDRCLCAFSSLQINSNKQKETHTAEGQRSIRSTCSSSSARPFRSAGRDPGAPLSPGRRMGLFVRVRVRGRRRVGILCTLSGRNTKYRVHECSSRRPFFFGRACRLHAGFRGRSREAGRRPSLAWLLSAPSPQRPTPSPEAKAGGQNAGKPRTSQTGFPLNLMRGEKRPAKSDNY